MKPGTRKSPRKMSQHRRQSVVTDNEPFDDPDTYAVVTPIAKGGVACPFPWRLHEMLEFVHKNEMEHIVSWDNKGKAFTVHDSKAFVSRILPRFFSQTKYASFQRQLNLYGFSRKRAETSLSCYYHHCFLREDPDLVRNMVRCKIKGNGKNRQRSPKPTRKGGKRGAPLASAPPVLTPVREDNSSSTSDGAESVVNLSPEAKDPEPTSVDLPLVGSSFPFYEVDILAHDQTDLELGFFEGSPFHLLESEPIIPVGHDTTTGYLSLMSQAPLFPYTSFHGDSEMPRLKLQPRSSSHYGAMSTDYMASFFL